MADCRDAAAIEILSEAGGGMLEPEAAEIAVAATGTAPAGHPGQGTYQQYCGMCHDVGVGGAPKLGDIAGWSPRIERGAEALIASAINGVTSSAGVMPPRGGFMQLSDDEVGTAVAYMMEASR